MRLAAILIATLLVPAARFARAEDDLAIHPQLGVAAVFAQPSAIGSEISVSGVRLLSEGSRIQLGPRVGVLTLNGSGLNRLDLAPGVEISQWIGNALGPGLGLDAIFPLSAAASVQDQKTRWRLDSFFSVRVKHLGSAGALGLRGGLFYDSQNRWAGKVGAILQLGGADAI